MSNPKYLTIPEAAELLRITVPTMYGWTHQKKIPFFKLGKHCLFDRDDLNKWIISHRTEAMIT